VHASCEAPFGGDFTTGNRKAAVSLLVAVRQTSGSRHRCLFAVSFLGGSRQTRNTRCQASMPWAGWLGSQQLENTRRGPLCAVSRLIGLTTHTTHMARAALSREQMAMAHDTNNTHVNTIARHVLRPGPLVLSWARSAAHGIAWDTRFTLRVCREPVAAHGNTTWSRVFCWFAVS
jgi:hypothetical protein